MASRTAFIATIGAAVMLAVTSADAADKLPGQPLDSDQAYILTQQHRDNLYWWNGTWTPQSVPVGAHVQVQLPSDPVRWTPVRGRGCTPSPVAGLLPTSVIPLRASAKLVGDSTLPNEGRMPGSSEISVFDYRLTGVGIAAICLRPEPRPEESQRRTATDFVVTLVVGVPQLSVP